MKRKAKNVAEQNDFRRYSSVAFGMLCANGYGEIGIGINIMMRMCTFTYQVK